MPNSSTIFQPADGEFRATTGSMAAKATFPTLYYPNRLHMNGLDW